MKNLLFFFIYFFLLLWGTSGIAQDSIIDSLTKQVSVAREDTNKVNLLLTLGKSYFSSDPVRAIDISKEARDLSEKLNFQKGLAKALKNIGLGYYNQGNYVETLEFWNQAMAVFQTLGDRAGVANMLSNIGAVYFDRSDDEKALDFYLRSLKVAEEIHDTLRITTVQTNIGAIYGKKSTTYDKAIEYDLKALALSEKLGDKDAIGTITLNLGEIYLKRNNDSLALAYFEKSRDAYQGSPDIPAPLNFIGKVYAQRGNYASAISYQQEAFAIAKKLDSKLNMVQSLYGMAKTYQQKGDYKSSLTNYLQAESIALEIAAPTELKEIYEGLAWTYSRMADFGNAYKYQNLLIGIKDTLYNIDTDRKLGTLLFDFEIEKKEGQINLLTKDKALQEANLQRQKVIKNVFISGFGVVLLFAGVFFTQRNRISKEKKRSDELLLNILPEETAEELKATGTAKTKSFDSVSVLFTDFKNFTQASERMSAEALVEEINLCYSAFDKIITRHGIEKIKTIGDAYMCAGGLPAPNTTHAMDIVNAGLEMQQFMVDHKQERQQKDLPFFELRLGIHSGPVVAGIVGIKKFAYDIWGDTVNTASRMESSGEIGKVNISGTTYELIKNGFRCVHRGKIQAKNKGEIDMYFVEGILREG